MRNLTELFEARCSPLGSCVYRSVARTQGRSISSKWNRDKHPWNTSWTRWVISSLAVCCFIYSSPLIVHFHKHGKTTMNVSMNGIYRSFQRISHQDLLLWYFKKFPRIALVTQSGVQKLLPVRQIFHVVFRFLFIFIFQRFTFCTLYLIARHISTCNRSEAKISPADY